MSAVDTITMMARDFVDEGKKKLIDNTFQATYLARTMRESAIRWAGGPAVNEYIVYTGSGGGGHVRGKRFTNTERQTDQQFRWTPRYLQVPIVVDFLDLAVLNAPNPYRIMDILESKISNAYITLGSQMEIALMLPGSGNTWGANINGWEEVTSAGTGATNGFTGAVYNTYGELDRQDANYGTKIRGNTKAVNAEISYAVLENTYTKCCIGGARPRIGYTTPLVKSAIKMQFQAAQRFQEAVEPTFGFVGFRFNEALIIDSRYCPGSELSSDDIADDYAMYTTEDQATPATAYPALTTDDETFWWINTGEDYGHYYISTHPVMGMGMMPFFGSAEHDGLVSRLRLAYIFASAAPRYHYQLNKIKVNV